MKENHIDYKSLGSRLKKLRLKSGAKQAEFAARVGLSPAYYSNIENARVNVRLTTLFSIASALNTTIDALICDSYEASPVSSLEFENLFLGLDPSEADFIIEQAKATKQLLIENRKNRLLSYQSDLEVRSAVPMPILSDAQTEQIHAARKKAQKTHYQRIHYGILTKEDYDSWRMQSLEKEKAVLKGQISFEDYMLWLRE